MNRRIVENVLNTPDSLPADQLTALSLGSIPAAVSAYITRKDAVAGVKRQTVLTIAALPLTITDALAYLGTKIFSFPKGRIAVASCLGSFAVTTTSTLSSTINSGGALSIALGTLTASNISLTSTMVDLMPLVTCTTSTVINVASATVNTALASAAQFDGTATAKDMFLNLAFPTNTDIDADGTVTVSGVIVINWDFLGAYSLVNGA